MLVHVNKQTCQISGFPSKPTPQTDYTLTMTYSEGAIDGAIPITVNGALTISPATATLPAQPGLNLSFQALGGKPPYQFSILNGPGIIDPGSGIYTSSNESGVTQIQLLDSFGHASFAQITNRRTWTNGSVNALASDGKAIYLGGQFNRVAFFSRDRTKCIRRK